MKTIYLALFAATAAALMTSVPAHAQQRSRQSETTVTTPRGSSTIDRSVHRQDGTTVRSTAATGPAGNTATRDASHSYDGDTGFQRESTTTGPNGRTATSQGTASCQDRSCTRSSSTTGPNGRTRGVEGSGSQLARGEYAGQRTVTTPRGSTRSKQRWVRIRKPQ